MAGVKDENFRAERQAAIAAKKTALDAEKEAKREARAKRSYEESVRKYENELRLDPPDTNPFGYKARKLEDAIGDKVRSAGKFFGINNMTSRDDEAQMQARKDVKGYKKGGKVSSASSRADGCAQRGKTKGRII